MATHIIIDGYNLIRQSSTLAELDAKNMQKGREALINRLATYKSIKGYKITVVFDAWKSDNLSEGRDKVKGIDIIYSKAGETADEVIKRMSSNMREGGIVITADNDIASFAKRQGCVIIEPRVFEERMQIAAISDMKGGDEDYVYPVKDKKGPSKRVPKAERKSMQKLKKL
ncbi:MAG: NYN domain-containing protein [Deltaproteobacteria bacterium]